MFEAFGHVQVIIMGDLRLVSSCLIIFTEATDSTYTVVLIIYYRVFVAASCGESKVRSTVESRLDAALVQTVMYSSNNSFK